MVDAAAIRAHLGSLQKQGVSVRRIAEAADVTRPTLYALLVGQPSKGLPPTRRVTHGVAQRLLAVTAEVATAPAPDLAELSDLSRVDAVGPRRRVQALAALGWSMQQIADQLGMARRQLQAILRGTQVSARTARAVHDVYDRLCWEAPPACTRWERSAVTRTKAWARGQDWVPPLAWDDDTIDDPAAVPQLGVSRRPRYAEPVDDVDLAALLAGDTRASRVSVATVRVAVGILVVRGLTGEEIAERLCTSERSVDRHRAILAGRRAAA